MTAEEETRVLGIQVDRVVDELRAFAWRKRRIREELLAHLVMSHQDELARARSPEAALAATLERWGGEGELRRELQRSVPVLERLAATPLPCLGPLDGLLWKKAPRESTRAYALRFAAWVTSSTFLLGLLAVGVMALLPNISAAPARGALHFVQTFGGALVALFVSAFAVAGVFDRAGLRARLEPASVAAPSAKGVIVTGYVVAMTLLFLGAFAALIAMTTHRHL